MATYSIGLRAHSGWAVLVAVAGTLTAPVVLQRRRIELTDHSIPGSRQPYHTARPMQLAKAQAFLDRCAEHSRIMAHAAIQTALHELTNQGHTVAASCILLGSGRTTTDLASILASHPAIHTAEGDFFREALRQACAFCGLALSGIKERDLLNQASGALRMSADQIDHRLSAIGKSIGPPWRQDEKLCALTGWLLLK